ncbi:hypothetical protein V2G26_010723 [Clonostachys chloroleuca]
MNCRIIRRKLVIGKETGCLGHLFLTEQFGPGRFHARNYFLLVQFSSSLKSRRFSSLQSPFQTCFPERIFSFSKSRQKNLQCFVTRRHHKIRGFRQRIICWVHTVHKSVWERNLPVSYFESAQSLEQLLTKHLRDV